MESDREGGFLMTGAYDVKLTGEKPKVATN